MISLKDRFSVLQATARNSSIRTASAATRPWRQKRKLMVQVLVAGGAVHQIWAPGALLVFGLTRGCVGRLAGHSSSDLSGLKSTMARISSGVRLKDHRK